MKLNRIMYAIAASFLFFSFLVLLDQYMRIGVWIQWGDLLHHETVAFVFFALGVGILAGLISRSNILQR
jgi:hypothetical protein